MKTIKNLMLGILFSSVCLSFSTTSFAIEESSKEVEVTKTSEVKTKITEAKKEIDLTPKFKIKEIKTEIGSKGTVEVEQVEGMKDLKGTFKTTVADQSILSINDRGQWQGLKSGITKATLDFEWDKESLQKIKEKYPDHQLVKKGTIQEVPVEVTAAKEKSVDITPSFNVGTISAKIGETGQFKVAPMGGLTNLTGTYLAYIPYNAKEIITVESDGKWTALKTGTVEFVLDFQLSDESSKEIQDKNPGSTMVTRDIASLIKVEVKPAGTLNITPKIELTSIDGRVGDTGQIKVKPIEGIKESTGSFAPTINDSSIIEVDSAGNWKALKAGTTSFMYMYNWSDETMKKLAEKYPGYEFYVEEGAQVVEVNITENTTASTKPVGTTKPTGKQLPATNDSSTNLTLVTGLFLVFLTAIGWCKKESLYR
ncbi:cell wall protein [Enterococcus silesiacus]|uniref:Cell wall protein n=1 Tax=Enterococcus silesiacus TaxID=332949 RepID=A0A0S3KDF3_9ENTE|nr:cell wall protein [Enterococcus silesiacus]ALS02261.1 cell wall protein [Enterococcus silesiacus]OJG92380.1 LPXTG-domain-containing protein cell wall anchor domain [Enterococcus silesiacus]